MDLRAQLTAQMLKEIQYEIDKEIIDSMLANHLASIMTDHVKFEAYMNFLLNRDFDYIELPVAQHIAKQSATSLGDLQVMFSNYILHYHILHGMNHVTTWQHYLAKNYHSYELHLLGIDPELVEVDKI